jgi:hypothetical protein
MTDGAFGDTLGEISSTSHTRRRFCKIAPMKRKAQSAVDPKTRDCHESQTVLSQGDRADAV